MEISEQLYKVNPLSKNNIWADANRDSHVTKLKGGEDDLPTNPKKVCAGKYPKKNCSLSEQEDDRYRGEKLLLHGPGHFSEKCKVLVEYSKR